MRNKWADGDPSHLLGVRLDYSLSILRTVGRTCTVHIMAMRMPLDIWRRENRSTAIGDGFAGDRRHRQSSKALQFVASQHDLRHSLFGVKVLGKEVYCTECHRYTRRARIPSMALPPSEDAKKTLPWLREYIAQLPFSTTDGVVWAGRDVHCEAQRK
jgi:hypothetical protein